MMCLKCSRGFVGTSRRKFCSDSCRVGYFNSRKQIVSIEPNSSLLGSSDKGEIRNLPDWAASIKVFVPQGEIKGAEKEDFPDRDDVEYEKVLD